MNSISRAIRPRLMAAGGLVLALSALGGCTPPAKVVTKITSARDQVKFLYEQGGAQGVIKCQVGQDGALSQCRNMTIELQD